MPLLTRRRILTGLLVAPVVITTPGLLMPTIEAAAPVASIPTLHWVDYLRIEYARAAYGLPQGLDVGWSVEELGRFWAPKVHATERLREIHRRKIDGLAERILNRHSRAVACAQADFADRVRA